MLQSLTSVFIQRSLILAARNTYVYLAKGHIYFINVKMANYWSPFISRSLCLLRTLSIDLVEGIKTRFLL